MSAPVVAISRPSASSSGAAAPAAAPVSAMHACGRGAAGPRRSALGRARQQACSCDRELDAARRATACRDVRSAAQRGSRDRRASGSQICLHPCTPRPPQHTSASQGTGAPCAVERDLKKSLSHRQERWSQTGSLAWKITYQSAAAQVVVAAAVRQAAAQLAVRGLVVGQWASPGQVLRPGTGFRSAKLVASCIHAFHPLLCLDLAVAHAQRSAGARHTACRHGHSTHHTCRCAGERPHIVGARSTLIPRANYARRSKRPAAAAAECTSHSAAHAQLRRHHLPLTLAP
jgi:hypothetical protein